MAKDFTFKQFHINAFNCGMPVSTDAILLGAWCNIEESKRILDIGCGTGLLSIMCAQRNSTAEIMSVEIEPHAYQAATKNYKNSPWDKRLHAIQADIKTFIEQSLHVNEKFTSIICNPPYFNDGEEATNKERAIARHTSTLSHVNLLKYCEQLLVDKGSAHFVLPKKEGDTFIGLLNIDSSHSNKLYLTRLTNVKTTITKPVSRVLIELTKQDIGNEIVEEQLTIHDGENYSADFINLTCDFYLKL